MDCGIVAQIAKHCDEPEQPECEICFSALINNECKQCKDNEDE